MHESRVSNSEYQGTPKLWQWALWFAVFAGLCQALLVAVARFATNRLILISPEVVWMAPAINVVVFGVAAGVVWLVTRRLGRSTAASVGLFVFLFLFILGPLLIVPRLHKYAVVILAIGLAMQGTRMIRARLEAFNWLTGRTLPILVGLSVVLGFGVHLKEALMARRAEAALPAAARDAPNVILIVLDTVRAQSLSLYGYPRPTSPRLDEFARTGVVFDRALASTSWTLPSHASFFTGRLPHELSADWLTPLDHTHTTIAEAFAFQGYVTVGFTANLLYTTAETGLNRGFARYSDFPLSIGTAIRESWLARALLNPLRGVIGDSDRLVRKGASDVNQEFKDWIASRPQKPFFAFLNYFDAHEPYLAPTPFDGKFGSGGPQGDITVRRMWSPEEIRTSNDAYDETIAYLDEQVGTLLATLRAQRLLDNTMVIVTSDHGEQFGEHGLFDHGNSLYRVVLHVPLVISFPGRLPAGARVSDPVSLVNLPATILDLADITSGESMLPGRSLAEYWRSPSNREKSEPVFAKVSKAINMPSWLPASKGDMQSVVVAGMHYIRNGDGREELYDFEHDTAELHDLARRTEFRPALDEARRTLEEALKTELP